MLKYQYIFIPIFLLFPFITLAQTQRVSAQGLLENVLLFIQGPLTIFLFGLAFLFFVINVLRYFIIGGSNEEGRTKAKSLAIYGIAAFVFLILFYGLVNLLVNTIGLGGTEMPCPDYMCL